MTDRRNRHRPSKPFFPPTSLPSVPGHRREFTMVPIEPVKWEMALDLLRLSPVQADIVAMLVQQASEQEMCDELGLTSETVRVYLDDIVAHVGITDPEDIIGIIKSM